MTISVSGLFVYPIKGCQGIRVEESFVTLAGLKWDRRFMVVDANGSFLSQRSHTALGRVETVLQAEGLQVGARGMRSLVLPRELPDEVNATRERVQIWRDEAEALSSSEGSAWFSEFLGEETRLVYIPDRTLRPTNPKYSKAGDRVGFADAYPLLCAGQASLDDLNARLPQGEGPLTMNRFRPNLVLAGTQPFEEDDLAEVRIGTVTFRRGRLCERCVVTTLDPETGKGSKEPLKTLAAFRRWEGAVWFGSNWIPDGEGTVKVGDTAQVVTRSPGRPDSH